LLHTFVLLCTKTVALTPGYCGRPPRASRSCVQWARHHWPSARRPRQPPRCSAALTLPHSRSSSSLGGHTLRWRSQKATFRVSGTWGAQGAREAQEAHVSGNKVPCWSWSSRMRYNFRPLSICPPPTPPPHTPVWP
jgi:hypothetical protein